MTVQVSTHTAKILKYNLCLNENCFELQKKGGSVELTTCMFLHILLFRPASFPHRDQVGNIEEEE